MVTRYFGGTLLGTGGLVEVLDSLSNKLHRLIKRTVNTDHTDDVKDDVLTTDPLCLLSNDVELDG